MNNNPYTTDPEATQYLNGDRTPHHFLKTHSQTDEGPCVILLPYNVNDDDEFYEWDDNKITFENEVLAQKFSDHVGVPIWENDESEVESSAV